MTKKAKDAALDDLEGLSQEERIERLQEKLRDLGGGFSTVSEDLDPEIHEEYLRHTVEMEEAGWSVPADLLENGGIELTPPDELDDTTVSQKLRELIHAMALHNMFLVHTDHLTDRELYTQLVNEHLRGESMLGPTEPKRGYNFIIDPVSSGSEEDTELFLRYYASDQDRAWFKEDWPDLNVPPKETPVADRDRFLPQPDWTPVDWDGEDPVM